MKETLGLLAKRGVDVALSAVGLIACIPILIPVVLISWVSMGRPIFFRQKRAGHLGRTFYILKFRTMTNATDQDGKLLPDTERLTRLGRILRSTSLDELPQLWNVLRGEMSLVGPRPLLVQYVERYTAEQAKRLLRKPGITGLAQVNGRNAITWEEKFKWDTHYCENWSLGLDLKIILLSVKQVLLREGISANDHSTMPEFMGSDSVDKRQVR